MAYDIALKIGADNSEARAALAETDRDIAGLAATAKKVGDKFTGLGKALMPVSVAVGLIGTGIAGMAKRGSDVADVAKQFDVLTRRVKETSGVMLGELRAGTLGVVSDYDLMKAANIALGNGLKTNATDMGVIAQGATLLSGRVGGDVAGAYGILTSAITKGSPAGLAQLGLFVDSDKAAADYATSIGKTASALTDQERSAAMQVGVISALKDQLDAAGGVSASFADRIDGITARGANFIDRLSTMASNSKGLADVMDIVVSVGFKVLDVVETMAGWFEKIPAPVQAGIVVFGLLVTAAAPVLMALGYIASAVGAILPFFAAGTTGATLLSGAMTVLTGPIGWVAAAVIALGTVWLKWGDDITRVVSETYTAVKEWLWDKLEPVLTPIIGLLKSVGEMFTAFRDLVVAIGVRVLASVVEWVGGVIMWLRDKLQPVFGPISTVVRSIAAVFVWAKDIAVGATMALYEGVKTWLLDRFTAIVDGVKAKVDAVTGFFKDMYMKVVGGSIVPDMIDGIEVQFGPRLQAAMVIPAQQATAQVSALFGELQKAIENIGSVIIGAIQSGAGVARAAGSSIFGALGKDLGNMVAAGIGGVLGKAVGSFLGPLGAMAGGWLGGLVDNIFSGNDTKKGRESLAGMLGFGSLADLNDALRGMGEEGQRLVHEGLNKIGKKDTAANNAWMQSVKALFAAQAKESAAAATAVEDAARRESDAQRAVQAAIQEKIDVLDEQRDTVFESIREELENPEYDEAGNRIYGVIEAQGIARLAEIDKQKAALGIQMAEASAKIMDEATIVRDGIAELFKGPIKLTFDWSDLPAGFGPTGRTGSGTSYAAMGGWVTPEGVKYYDTGGWVKRGSDTVPAMLTPGEFVVSKKGVAALSALNRGNAGGFSGGKQSQTIVVQVERDTLLKHTFEGMPAYSKFRGA